MLNATPLSGPGSKTGKAGRGTPIAPAYTATLRAARAAQRKGFDKAAEALFLAGQEEKLAYGASRDPAMQRLQQEAAKVAAAPTAAETAGGAPKFVEMAGATTAPTAAEPAGSFAKPATGNMLNQRLNFAKQLRESSGAGGVDLAAAAKQGKSLGLTQENVQSFLQRNELKEKPGTTMPDMLHALAQPTKDEVVDALTHYLMSLSPDPRLTGSAAAESRPLLN